MSGIVGIINLDGTPVDRALLMRMTEFMSFRGPDAQEIWIDGNVGFGHTMLRTTFEAETEKHPLTLDGKVWLTADARIDGRAELISELEAKLRTSLRTPAQSNGNGSDSRTPNDAELILYAYQAWGEDCVEHLIGDFAFAIWDGRERRLFCARDHFGVKPFFYAQVGRTFLFSNTLNCVRTHPQVSDKLNELAIGDFLLFGFNHELSTTTFAEIQRLPPAHLLQALESVTYARRYWTLPLDGSVRYRKGSDYIDRFKDLLRTTIGDRLRTKSAGVFMSGGLDSTTVAAMAFESLSGRLESFQLRAYNIFHKELFSDEENFYSKLVANSLGIPITYLIADDYKLYDGWDRKEIRKPEPTESPLLVMAYDHLKQVEEHSRTVLTGYGVDPALCQSNSHGIDRLKRAKFGDLAQEMAWFLFSRRQLPRLGFRGWLKGQFAEKVTAPAFPVWLNEDFVGRAKLLERWRQVNDTPLIHPTRPQGYRSLTDPFWPDRFESYDPGVTYVPCEVKYPFFDIRMMTYLLAIPTVPWCTDKELIRKAMHGTLPEPVRRRPKTVLAGDPVLARMRQHEVEWMDSFEGTSELSKYVEREAVPSLLRDNNPDEVWRNVRPLCLNLWLLNRKHIEPQSGDL